MRGTLMQGKDSWPTFAWRLMWIRNNPHVTDYLTGLATGRIELSHEGLSRLPSWRTAAQRAGGPCGIRSVANSDT